VGVGIGGNFEYSAILAKKALLRNINIKTGNEYYDNLENKILKAINETGIGAQGRSFARRCKT
jgi:fumarate hydratase subunit alpha